MRKVTYAGGSFVTGDDIAEAVLAYAAALANSDRAATIHVPSDGGATVEMLVGPSSQVLTEAVESDGADPDGDAFVAELQARIARLEQGPAPHPDSAVEWDV
jgi:hypothetical protein